jgi:hypothetical protein
VVSYFCNQVHHPPKVQLCTSHPQLPRTIATGLAMSHQSTRVARNRQVTSSWPPEARSARQVSGQAQYQAKEPTFPLSAQMSSLLNRLRAQFRKQKLKHADINTCFNNSTPTCICYAQHRNDRSFRERHAIRLLRERHHPCAALPSPSHIETSNV